MNWNTSSVLFARRDSVSGAECCGYEHSTDGTLTGILVDDEAKSLIGQGREIKNSKPRKEDIVQE